MTSPFVQSNFARQPDDFYPTIDPRCVWGFLEHFTPTGTVIDVCAPDGSGIIAELTRCGIEAHCGADAFVKTVNAEWIVTNPPYDRKLVDGIINRQIERVSCGEVYGLAVLLRSTFDHAKSRCPMFRDNPFYAGQIKLLFRPWWSESRDKQPIHNYVWQVWLADSSGPVVRYAATFSPDRTKHNHDALRRPVTGANGREG